MQCGGGDRREPGRTTSQGVHAAGGAGGFGHSRLRGGGDQLRGLDGSGADARCAARDAGDVAGGGLKPTRWSAAGYAEFDPIAGNVEQQSKDDQQKNRRVELVVQPNVEEMLNLGNIK